MHELAVMLASLLATTSFAVVSAAPRIPQSSPTISGCATVTQAPITPTVFAEAISGCTGVQGPGTNYTRNDLIDGVCKPISLLFAHGTGEEPNMGNLVGPPLTYALNATFGENNVAVQGIPLSEYTDTMSNFCKGGSVTASRYLALVVKSTATRCPETKLLVSGYSQGAQVVHNAMTLLKDDLLSTIFVNAVVFFGDPDQGLPVGNIPRYKIKSFCHDGDDVCHKGDHVFPTHLSYCKDTLAAIDFMKSRVRGIDGY